MSQEQNVIKKYAQINEKLERDIKYVNIQEVIEAYCSGVHKEHIKISFRLTDEELLYILKKNVIPDMVKRRNESLDRLKGFNFDLTVKEEEIPSVTLQEAIDLVEGKGERE